jgi:hypothetical protein
MIRLALICLLIISQFAGAHPHHHSLLVIDNNKENKQLELSLKLLTEDYKKLVKIAKLEKYIAQHLKITTESESLNMHLLGKEINPEFTWIYLSCDYKLNNTKQLTIHNSILLNINENQFNTVKVNFADQHLSHNFSSIETSYNFELNDF